jgi:hypothetical protein
MVYKLKNQRGAQKKKGNQVVGMWKNKMLCITVKRGVNLSF